MTGPRLGMGMPPDASWFSQQLSHLQRQITELRAARTLDASTISPNGTLTINGSEVVNGTLNVTGAMVVGGTLSLPAGIINNAALTSPTTPLAVDGSTGGIAMPTSMTTLRSDTVTVPAGFTAAAVLLTVSIGATSGPSGGNLFGRATINGVSGVTIAQAAGGASFGTTMAAFRAAVLTGLTGGGTFTISGDGYVSSAGWTGGNAQQSALITFYR